MVEGGRVKVARDLCVLIRLLAQEDDVWMNVQI